MGRGLTAEVFATAMSPEVIKVTPSEEHLAASTRLTTYLSAIEAAEARNPPSYATLEEAIGRMQVANTRTPVHIAARMVRFGMRRGKDGRFTWKFDQRVRLGSPFSFSMQEAKDIWQRISGPVLFVNGGDNQGRRHVSEGFTDMFPGSRTVEIPGAAHGIHQEQPLALATEIRNFIVESVRTDYLFP
jgi:pimeloyl-ACP methyl ester carboxylesterase